jgi:tripartite-type tricarboxylate transporter receptor subunit TctC
MVFAPVGPAFAQQNYPDRPIKLIVPFPPGGPIDTMARLMGQELSARVGTVVVENRPGAGSTMGTKSVAAADPDGYTLLFGSSGSLAVAPALYSSLGIDPLKVFTPVATVALLPHVFVVNLDVPAKTIGEFVTYAKANPGKLSVGFAQGTVSQLLAEYFNHRHGLDITSVPYRGGALVIPDMLGGRIHVYWPTPATVLPLIREGKIKALAISSPQRNPDLPDVPTMKELGLDELTLEFWAGMWAPAGVPADVVEKLNAAVNEALQSSEMIASLKKLGFESRIASSQDFAAFVAAEIPRWTAVVKASGVKSQ